MRISYLFILLPILISCHKDSKTFETIDLSIFSGDEHVYCFKIYNNGLTSIYDCDPFNRKFYYNIKLSNNQIDTISGFAKSIMIPNADTLYLCSSGYIRHGVYVLFINTLTNRYKYYIDYTCEKKGNINKIFKLIGYIHHVGIKDTKSINNDFHFDSYLKFMFPPPPKDDKFESDYYKKTP